MCTVSWRFDAEGYDVLFNRDERRERLPAAAPCLTRCGGVTVLAPRDGDRGGAWLAVNAHGLTAGMLNHYPTPAPTAAARRSRGLLLLDLMAAPNAAACLDLLAATALDAYAPFRLVAIARGGAAAAAAWDGRALQVAAAPVAPPVSSSSFRGAEVVAGRLAAFPAGGDLAALRAYHAGHLPERGPFAVCMHRPDAQTVSFSHIRVAGGRARFAYQAGAPCEGQPVTTAELALNPEAA